MSDAAPPVDLGAALDQVFADLTGNKPEAEIIGRLRALEQSCEAPNRDRARFLNARGLVMNRMGQRSEALGDLIEFGVDLYADWGLGGRRANPALDCTRSFLAQ